MTQLKLSRKGAKTFYLPGEQNSKLRSYIIVIRAEGSSKMASDRLCLQFVFFTALLSTVSSCTSQTVKMVQPQTGATADCSGSSYGFGQLFTESFVDSCARAYQDRGFVPLERLSPEARADLEKRGLLPKD